MTSEADQAGRRICHWCHSAIGQVELRVSETERAVTRLNDWVLCSWACAHELVSRMLRSRDFDPGAGDD